MAEHETEPAAKRRCLPQPIPKHTIFLSHSGNEKAFAEQLCEDLKRMNHDPFFDQDSYSLPKGERFPSLIFSAAEQCLLGVVVLSEGYLSSKWPMLELSTFMKSMKGENPNLKLFPVFYKLSPSDITAKKVKKTWAKSWKKLVQKGEVSAEEISSWSDAVRVLRAFNGVEFSKHGTSEVRYRAAVVEEICKNVPPVMKYKTDDIRGYERLCKVTSRMFEEGTSGVTCREGCNYLGLHGLGGVGKSTLCKAMRSYFQKEYGSRVCYVELPSDAEAQSAKKAEKGRISRLKSVIQRLTGYDTRIVDRIDSESQGLECLQSRLRVRGQLPVFLAVDNVGDSECSRDEARGLVKSVFANGSKVMVTSRSRAILKSIFGEEKYCKPISRLETDEARELFLSVAAPKKLLCPLQPCEGVIVEACLRECQFEEDGYGTQQYHPLVLRALGSYFHDVDEDNIMKWEKHISVENKLQGCRESKQVNNILGLNYSSLSDAEKLIFLDVALLLNVWVCWGYYGDSRLEAMDYEWLVSFIARLHGISPIVAERKLEELQRKSLIYEGSPSLKLHDLYIEFAQSLVLKEGSREREWWVDSKNWAVGMNFGLMKRFRVDGDTGMIVPNPKQLRQCEKLQCLIMQYCRAPKNFSLDLGCLKSLRVLIVDYVEGMVEITCSSRGDGDEGCLQELCFVRLGSGRKWDGHFCESALERIPFLLECGNLKWLAIDVFKEELMEFIHNVDLKIFEKLKALEVLHLYYCSRPPFERTLNYISGLQSLRFLDIDWFSWADGYCSFEDDLERVRSVDVSPLGGLRNFSTLCCSNSEFEGVNQQSHLTTLGLGYSKNLRQLPNLERLPNLREICIAGCCSLEEPISILENYEEIKSHTYCKCHQPFCNDSSCAICVDRHRRSGVTCQVHMDCNICSHLKNNPGGCDFHKNYVRRGFPGCSICELRCPYGAPDRTQSYAIPLLLD